MSSYINEYSEQTVGRPISEIKREAKTVVEKIIKNVAFCVGNELRGSKVREIEAMEISEMRNWPRVNYDEVKAALVGFLAARGKISEKRYWLWFGNDTWICFPLAMEKGVGGSMQIGLYKEIADVLDEAGSKSAIYRFLLSTGRKLPETKKKYCFGKSYYLCETKEEALVIKEDMDKIIQAMNRNRGRKVPVFEEKLKFMV